MEIDPNSLQASCEHCRAMFPLPKAAAGSLQNCPECGLATHVGGENDPLWTFVEGFAVLALLVGTVLAAQVFGPIVGAATFFVAGGLMLLIRAAL